MIYDNLKEPCPDQKATSIFFPEPVMKLTYLKCVCVSATDAKTQ